MALSGFLLFGVFYNEQEFFFFFSEKETLFKVFSGSADRALSGLHSHSLSAVLSDAEHCWGKRLHLLGASLEVLTL